MWTAGPAMAMAAAFPIPVPPPVIQITFLACIRDRAPFQACWFIQQGVFRTPCRRLGNADLAVRGKERPAVSSVARDGRCSLPKAIVGCRGQDRQATNMRAPPQTGAGSYVVSRTRHCPDASATPAAVASATSQSQALLVDQPQSEGVRPKFLTPSHAHAAARWLCTRPQHQPAPARPGAPVLAGRW